jgi:RNA polymerase sigma factor (sigma-70 family)
MLQHTLLRSPWNKRQIEKKPARISPPKQEGWQVLVEKNLRLAYWCLQPFVKGFRCRVRIEEWESVALEALVRAARGYDPSYRSQTTGQPVKFTTYATWSIRNTLFRYQEVEANNRLVLTDFGAPEGQTMIRTDQVPEPETDPFEYQEDSVREVAALIRKAGLTERQKEGLTMHYLQGAPYKEIACKMGVTNQRARQLVLSAVRKLRMSVGLG